MSDQGIMKEGSIAQVSQIPEVGMVSNEGVDAEIKEDTQEQGLQQTQSFSSHEKNSNNNNANSASRSSGRDSSGDSPRKHRNSSDRRRHHHHHHGSNSGSSSHHKRRKSGHNGEDGEDVEDGSRSRRYSESAGDDHGSAMSSGNNGRSSHRHRDRHSSHSQRSRRRGDSSRVQAESIEDLVSLPPSRKAEKEKAEAEAEDGEILEDGELDDDDDENNINNDMASQEESRFSLDTSHEDLEESPKGKSANKEDGRSQKRDKKKADRRDKRRKDNDKKKRKKYIDMDKQNEEDPGPAPAWGSGYQGAKPKSTSHTRQSHSPPPYGKPGKGSRDKGYQSPPGLYDSPSYSEGSEDEQYSRAMYSDGYLDASVAADEKEGIFKRGMSQKRKKRMDRGYGKRRQDFGKSDGPPKKKALIDIAMSDRPKCKFFKDGKCAKGSGCPFNHDVEQAKRMEVCKYHLTVKGCHKERCLYMHEDFPCKYYHTGAKCFSGDRCKFSHDPLTEESRKALEMRVAPEDIIDYDNPDDDDPDYDYQPRNYESRSRPSLLGSPPRQQHKKIPSLFEIEVHPPAPSPKPSPSSVRPSGFYNEAGSSPPSSGSSSGNSQGTPVLNNSSNNNSSNSNNMNVVNTVNNQSVGGPGLMRPGNPNMSGPGLLQTPSMPPAASTGSIGSMLSGPLTGNRPPLIGNPPLRPGFPFMNHPNTNPPSSNLPPVLNMLGAIIREAALQKVNNTNSVNMNMNNMGNMNMGPNNMNIMPPNSINNAGQNNMNNVGPNQAMHGMSGANVLNNMNMMQGNMNSVGPNSMNNMGPNNLNRMVPGVNQMGPNNMNPMGPNSMNGMGPNSMSQPNENMSNNAGNMTNDGNVMPFNMASSNNNGDMGEQEDMMDVDYRIKQNFDDKDDVSQDLTELDSIRRRLQEQINEEDAEEEDNIGHEEEENKMDDSELTQDAAQSLENKTNDKVGLSPEPSEYSITDMKANNPHQSEKELETIEIPSHLPKKQRELFMRIQQQHILREREKGRQEALRAAEEAEVKEEKDDWYSDSDEDEDKTNISTSKDEQKPVVKAQSNAQAPASATPSTYNIMQMINAIRKQGTSSSTESTAPGTAGSESTYSGSQESGHTIETKAPASPSASPPSQSSPAPFFPTVHAEEPPIISAIPKKPLKYAIVRINLAMPKTYTIIPNDVDISDPVYRFDPRIKRHLQLVDKQLPAPKEKEVRRNSVDSADKSAKLVDPRLKRAPTDPRLAKMGGGSPGSGRLDEGRPVDPRLKKESSQTRLDPRLAKRSGSTGNDPRLNRQISQDPSNQMMSGNFTGNNNLMGNLNNMGGPINNMAGPMNNMTGPMNNMAGPLNNMVGPMNNMGGFGTNQMGGLMNGPLRPMQGGPPMSNMNRLSGPIPPMGNPVNNMSMPMNNMGGNRMPNPVVGNPQGNIMGGQSLIAGPMNRMGGPRDMPVSISSTQPPENSSDLLLNQRPPADPRLNDPRLVHKTSETQDTGMNRNDPRLMSGQQRLKDPANDPRLANDPRRASGFNQSSSSYPRGSDRGTNLNDISEERESFSSKASKLTIEPLPSLSPSASLPPLPSLSPPVSLTYSSSSSSVDTQLSTKESSIEVQKPAKKFDYRNDPRFKRVKRTAAARQSSMEYSSPLGDDGEGQNSQELSGSLQYNSYNRPKPSNTSSPHRQNAPSPSLPDTLQDFDSPDLPPPSETISEPDLKVKDLFKTIDPTASPFC